MNLWSRWVAAFIAGRGFGWCHRRSLARPFGVRRRRLAGRRLFLSVAGHRRRCLDSGSFFFIFRHLGAVEAS